MEENQNPPYHDLAFRPLELLLLEERWNNGGMGKYVPLVQKFVEDRQDEIRMAAGPNPSHESIARGVIQLVLLNKSLDHASEMLDQMEEISREIWIRGERGDYDSTRIAVDWADEFGDSWRRWRLLKYTFVAVKCSMDIYRKLVKQNWRGWAVYTVAFTWQPIRGWSPVLSGLGQYQWKARLIGMPLPR